MYRTGIRPIVNGAELDVPIAAISAGELLSYDGTSIVSVPVGPGGNVTGPGVSVNNNIAVWNGVSGTLLADGGTTIAALQAATAARGDFFGPGSSVAGNIVTFANGTGKLGADAGFAPKWAGGVEMSANGAVVAGISTMTEVTGLTTAIPSAGTYWIDCVLRTQFTAGVAPYTVTYAIGVSANFTRAGINWTNATSPTTMATEFQTAAVVPGDPAGFGYASGSKSIVASAGSCSGTVVVSGACSVRVMFAVATAAHSVQPLARSAIRITRL